MAGSDPTGGAGLQGDLKTFAAHGAAGTAVVTAVTIQGSRGVRHVFPMPPDLVAEQVALVLEEVRPRAWKTGMLWDGPIVRAVAGVLSRRGASPLVVDPVLTATAGGDLLLSDALSALKDSLFALADLVTPNLPEAARLLGRTSIPEKIPERIPERIPEKIDEKDVEDAARALLALGCRAVLLKGGHAGGTEAVDVLATAEGVTRFSLPRLPGANVHGTGCALSASITARLGRGEPLEAAIRGAKAYVHRAIAEAHRLGPGTGLVHSVPP